MEKIKNIIIKWLGVRDKHTFYALRLERLSPPDPREVEFQREIEILANKYSDVPMVFFQNLKWSWEENDSSTFIHLPDAADKTLHGLIMNNTFYGTKNDKPVAPK